MFTDNVTEDAIEMIASLGYEPQYGARPVKRVLQKEIINELSKSILAGTVNRDAAIKVDAVFGRIHFVNAQIETGEIES